MKNKLILLIALILLIPSISSASTNYIGYEKANLYQAWDKGLTGRGIKVAIIDTAFDLGVTDFKEHIEFYDKDESMLNLGHGTVTAAAFRNVAPNADIYALATYNRLGGTWDAIKWCIYNDVDIISMSVEMGKDANVENLIATLISQNKIIIASAGNGRRDISYPANYNGVWSVGGVNYVDNNFYQCGFNNNSDIDFIFEGLKVPTKNQYSEDIFVAGTSLTAPVVAGMTALLMEEYPNATRDELKQLLTKDSFKVDGVYGVYPVYPTSYIPPAKPIELPKNNNYDKDLAEIMKLSKRLNQLIEDLAKKYE